MDIKDYVWDKQGHTVSWSFNGEVIIKRFENLSFAFLNTQDKYILIRKEKDGITEQVYYISYEGKQLFSFDKVNGKVNWQHNNQLIEVNCQNTESAKIYFNYDIIITIIAINKTYKKIIGFSLDGKILFEKKEPPMGYRFYYLSSVDKLPTVVCTGGDTNEDFHFSIDTKTGDMLKVARAY